MVENKTNEETMEKQVEPIRRQSSTLVARATKLKIESNQDLSKSTSILADISGSKKQIETMRKSFTQPLNESLKNINGFFKKLEKPLTDATAIIKTKILTFHQEQERIKAEEEAKQRELARKAEELARKAEEEKNKKKAEELAKKAQEMQEKAMEIPAEVATTTQGVRGGATTIKKIWKFQIIDKKAIPHEYLMPDEQAIRRAIQAGLRDLPGVKIYQEEIVATKI